jgi:hypothetical protein
MRTLISAVLILLVGCNARMATPDAIAPDEAAFAARAQKSEVLTESLFKEDQKVISNEDIARILNSPIQINLHAKVAIVRAGRLPHWFGWSEDFTRMNRQIDEQLMTKLKSASRVRDAVYLPTMAMPQELSIPHLRQAAARFQSDMVLVYRTFSRTYERQRFFSNNDETRAYATLEALLIDTRTGVIPFSTIVTEDFSATRTRKDVDFNETVAKAEQQAIANAQLRMADQVVAFLTSLPK